VLGAGEGRITALDGSIEYIAIIGGFVQVRPDRVVVLAESADLSGELDTAAVEKAKAAAEAAISGAGTQDPASLATARASLSRALLHLRVAERRRKR
jgi:F-type H+-transporting ATPase subunit epsilon